MGLIFIYGDPGASLVRYAHQFAFGERTAFSSHNYWISNCFFAPVLFGDPGASRTHNLFLRTELLYPLSYQAV